MEITGHESRIYINRQQGKRDYPEPVFENCQGQDCRQQQGPGPPPAEYQVVSQERGQ